MRRIYLASSWKNPHFASVYNRLSKVEMFETYNFQSSSPLQGPGGPHPQAFNWEKIDTQWKSWDRYTYRHNLLQSPISAQGYLGDLRGMEWADTCVLLLPSGRSAHLEAGYMKGRGKSLFIYIPEDSAFDPDLMYLLADQIVVTVDELCEALHD